ncbi:MAG: 3-deoxy-manno-octulosonate cytidylyltransferase [Deltaproteobacteria bacterium]|nr:3-deoxy-manno-octulosonate cytidylyltransferase [Deltaproteobacteria bacterium]
MTAVGIIPARYGSSRFPGKPLVEIAGRTMSEHVWRGARRAKTLREVYVATDDERIAACCENFGAPVLMTRDTHPTGTDRLAEAAANLPDDIIVNIQGDEPLIQGFVVDAAVDALLEDDCNEVSTLAHAADLAEIDNPNRVKVAIDRRGYALYFSRSPIPYPSRSSTQSTFWQHVGIYAYRRDFLLQFVNLARTPAECSEALEQLRVLEHGFPIRVGIVEHWRSVAVDVPDDVLRAETSLRGSREGERSVMPDELRMR